MYVLARGRDLLTTVDGDTLVLDEVTVTAVVEYWDQMTIRSIEASPADASLTALCGRSAAAGFRREVAGTIRDHVERRSVLALLLDDLPAALKVSGHALLRGGSTRLAKLPVTTSTGICAGWREGSTMVVTIRDEGRYAVTTGPPAPSLTRPEDPLAWHAMPLLEAHSLRRRRRLDITVGELVRADALLRDSYVTGHGLETVLHEYEVGVTVDPDTREVVTAQASPRALPWIECTDAAGSVGPLVGRQLGGLRRDVTREFVGTSTCTHLNDMFRSLDDVRALAPADVDA